MMANKERGSQQVDYDWQSGKTGSECNKHMLDNEICCDVTFLLGEKRREVKAHKYILISRSCVFYAMFCGPLAEQTAAIAIPDVEPEIFKLLLRYMYCDTADIQYDQAFPILYAAKKYALRALAGNCVTVLKDGINTETVCCILEQAHLYDESELRRECLDFISCKSEAVLKSEGFLHLGTTILKVIVSANIANLREVVVYDSLVSWASEECKRKSLDVNDENKRTVLGDLLRLVRFPIMDKDDFVRKVSTGALLNENEKIEIFQYLLTEDSKLLSSFSYETRTSSLLRLIRFRGSADVCSYGSRKADAITFLCNKPSRLVGIVVYRNLEGNKSHTIYLCLLDSAGYELSSVYLILSTKVMEELYDVLFERPVAIQPFQKYTIKMVMVSNQTTGGSQGQASITEGEFKVSFFKSALCTNGTDVSRGQLPGFLFMM